MDYSKLGSEIIRLVGGKENITNLGHCATRLRFSLKDSSLAQTGELKATKGVLGVVDKGGQYQVIIGNTVHEVCTEIQSQLGLKTDAPAAEECAVEEKKKSVPAGFVKRFV